MASTNILDDTKKILGIDAEYTAFDLDVVTHINTVFANLQQLGIGPTEGFMIEDTTSKWEEFLGTDKNLNPVKTYVYLRVRMLFDPPTTSFHLASLDEQRKELEWRLNVYREEDAWTSPNEVPTT